MVLVCGLIGSCMKGLSSVEDERQLRVGAVFAGTGQGVYRCLPLLTVQ